MNKKKDFSSALRATSTQQKAVIEDRFSRADSVLLNPAGAAAAASVAQAEPVRPPAPKELVTQLVTRDTFSMPTDEHAIIEKLRLIAAKEDVLVNKSEIVRCGLSLLAEVTSDELIKRLAGLKKGKPGRK
jgi:hypothetical protein